MDGGGKRRNKSKTKNKSKSKTKTKNKSKTNSSRPDLTPEEIEALRELKARVNSGTFFIQWEEGVCVRACVCICVCGSVCG